MPHHAAFAISACLVLSACVRSRPASGLPSTTAAVVTSAVPESTSGVSSLADSVLEARRRGWLDVVVRPADRPTQPLPGALVMLLIGRDTLHRITDDTGRASFELLAPGNYELRVRRIAYGTATAVVSVNPGCRTSAEAFVAAILIGIDPPPPRRGRVTISTC